MAKKRTNPQQTQGTFAQLYDVHEEMSRRDSKPLGRPPKKIQRKPTTVHLAQSESRNLSKLHLLVNEYLTLNRSELVGVAIDTLTVLIESRTEEIFDENSVKDIDALKRVLCDFAKS
jgi:hypothetical protein